VRGRETPTLLGPLEYRELADEALSMPLLFAGTYCFQQCLLQRQITEAYYIPTMTRNYV
jgi:hypothetical protein